MTDMHSSSVASTSAKLVLLAMAMFAFAMWVMPPLYDLFCEVTGLNGKTKGPYQAVEVKVDTSRQVTVQFIATNNEGMPWQFAPEVKTIQVHPGEATTVKFLAKNPTVTDMVSQATPSVVPFKASDYFHKTECFCFQQQPLKAGESAELPLVFIVDQDLPKQIKTITLSYTLFDVTDRVNNSVASVMPSLMHHYPQQQFN